MPDGETGSQFDESVSPSDYWVNGDTVPMFFQDVFGNCRGYLCIHMISGKTHTEEFFEYPEDVQIAQEFLRGNATRKGVNLYFHPVLFKTEDSSGEIADTPVVCADLNTLSPVLVTPTPDMIVESSRGRYQAYWLRQDSESVIVPLSVNGVVEADTKLKRVPLTYNWKYHGEPWKVKLLSADSLDTCDKVRKRYNLYGEQFEALFRSTDRWSLARVCGRLGASAQEVFLVLWGSQLVRLGNQTVTPSDLVTGGNDDTVSISTLYRESVNAVAACRVPSLLSDEELRSGSNEANSSSGFVERYVSWATTCTDSPLQYHVAGALTILSSLLCPHLRLATSFGEFRPNLWFMILAGTTITRKSTSMRLAVRLLEDVHDDPILATDGTPEGIISELSDRDGKSSLFYRDEITGLIEAMTRKDYLAGMLEVLTKLYDGEKEKRTLRRQTIVVRDPNLVILSGGIKNKMAEILDAKHIGSGFLPRFLVVSGWSGIEDMKPIGPPEGSVDDFRENLITELTKLYKFFSKRPPVREVDGTKIFQVAGGAKAHITKLSATQQAWERIRKLEVDVRELGLSSDNPDVFGPIYERMMNSIIKVAMLICADRCVREGKSEIEMSLTDIVTAISYSDVWIESVYEIAHGIDDKPTDDERKVEAIESYILKSDTEVSRSELMRRFRMSARQMNEVEATLVMRGTVIPTSINDKKKVYRSTTSDAV